MARHYQIASVLFDVLKTVTPGKHEVLYPIITSPYNMLFHLNTFSISCNNIILTFCFSV